MAPIRRTSRAKLGGLLAGPCHATTTLLGIAEQPADEQPLRAALESEAELLRSSYGVSPEIVMRKANRSGKF